MEAVKTIAFDVHAEKYDSWFLRNKNVLYSEVKLVAHCLKDAGRIYSVGCGSGLFEKILEQKFNIQIKEGLEPSKEMAEIAVKRGLKVDVCMAEEADYNGEQYDTILYNGCPSYITDLDLALANSYRALKPGGKIILIDVPKESGYGMMYNLAKAAGSWSHELLTNVYPANPYPIELVEQANWRTTQEKIETMKKAGFKDFSYHQTLVRHPIYSNNVIEEPINGYDQGDYVAVCAYKK